MSGGRFRPENGLAGGKFRPGNGLAGGFSESGPEERKIMPSGAVEAGNPVVGLVRTGVLSLSGGICILRECEL